MITFLAHQVTYSSTNHIYTFEEHKMQTLLSITIESQISMFNTEIESCWGF